MIEKLLELEGADAGHRGEGSLSFLAAETSLDAEVVHKLALGQVNMCRALVDNLGRDYVKLIKYASL